MFFTIYIQILDAFFGDTLYKGGGVPPDPTISGFFLLNAVKHENKTILQNCYNKSRKPFDTKS